MPSGLNLPKTVVRISNHFEGPNFVNGLAIQNASYTVLNGTTARLEFAGGFDTSITYVQIVRGTGFGVTADGRFTGTVTSYVGFEKDAPQNRWTFENLDTSLDRLNTLVSDPAVTFADLLVIPLVYEFHGAEFDDIFITGSFDDVAFGYDGDDNYSGLSGADTLYGGIGADTLRGQDGADRLFGGRGSDMLYGGREADSIFGGGGDDLILGGSEADLIRGGAGSDVVRGGAGGDTIHGGGGADTISGAEGDDLLYGGSGDDVLAGGQGGDSIEGGGGDDVIRGGDGANFLFGQAGADRLTGGDDSDELFGGAGDDRLASGAGADFVIGGAGDDRLSANLSGGDGDVAVDTFIFVAAFGRDVITDFEIGFDGIAFAGGITEGDVTTRTRGDDVIIDVDVLDGQRVVVLGVAGQFDPGIDISFG